MSQRFGYFNISFTICYVDKDDNCLSDCRNHYALATSCKTLLEGVERRIAGHYQMVDTIDTDEELLIKSDGYFEYHYGDQRW